MTQTREAINRHNNPLMWVFLSMLMFIIMPTIFPKISELEGRLLPVTSQLEIVTSERTENGLSFFVSFEKTRQCDFEGLAWYRGDHRLVLDFEPSAIFSPVTRPTGGQYVGPWLLYGQDDLEGTHAVTFHQCHPFWTTVTSVYP